MRRNSMGLFGGLLACVCTLLLMPANPAAQERPAVPPAVTAQQQAMEPLAYMVGTWEGDGWMEIAGRRAAFRGSEVVQRKLNGLVLQVEGHFLARIPGVEDEVPVHSTLAVISYAPQAKRYRLASWLATGTSGENTLTLDPKGWHWELNSPAGLVRYTMTLTDAGEWFEIGERSTDGKPWQKFFEMTLRKR